MHTVTVFWYNSKMFRYDIPSKYQPKFFGKQSNIDTSNMVRNTFWQSFTYPSSSSFRKLGVIRCDSSKAMFKGAPCVVITTSPHCSWVWFIAKSPMNVYDTICMTFIFISVGLNHYFKSVIKATKEITHLKLVITKG